jgi:hypothetical protein
MIDTEFHTSNRLKTRQVYDKLQKKSSNFQGIIMYFVS